MAIRVTCPGCYTRFNVSDKFAGREGPCPKCKKQIKIPEKEAVQIAEPDSGVKDSKGRSILKPIRRAETKITQVQWTIIAVCVVGFLLAALMLRILTGDTEDGAPIWMLALAALFIAPPIVYVAYQMLRDPELGNFDTSALRNRVLICSAIYALLWLAMPLGYIAFNDKWTLGAWLTGMIPMLGIGAGAGMLLFDLDYILGLVHYGVYLGICLLGRWIAGVGVLPGINAEGSSFPTTTTTTTTTSLLDFSFAPTWETLIWLGTIWLG